MKVRELINELLNFNLDAEVLVSTGDTFDDVADFELSWGSPTSADGEKMCDAKFVYIHFEEDGINSEKL